MQRCQRCGGSILPEENEYWCLQCGCEHDKRGNVIKPKVSTLTGVRPNFREGSRLRVVSVDLPISRLIEKA